MPPTRPTAGATGSRALAAAQVNGSLGGGPPRQASSAGPSASAAAPMPKEKPLTLAEENGILRRENAELRQQLLHIMASTSSPTVPPAAAAARDGGGALPAMWLEAQTQHATRRAQLLSDALCLKGALTADIEMVLLQLRSIENGPPAQWCRDALRRIRSVQFAEEVAAEIKAKREAELAGPGAPQRAGRSNSSSVTSLAAARRLGAAPSSTLNASRATPSGTGFSAAAAGGAVRYGGGHGGPTTRASRGGVPPSAC